MLYVNAGTQLATIETVDQIFSTGIIISFALLGIFPLSNFFATNFADMKFGVRVC